MQRCLNIASSLMLLQAVGRGRVRTSIPCRTFSTAENYEVVRVGIETDGGEEIKGLTFRFCGEKADLKDEHDDDDDDDIDDNRDEKEENVSQSGYE
jgi:hypothetical protein